MRIATSCFISTCVCSRSIYDRINQEEQLGIVLKVVCFGKYNLMYAFFTSILSSQSLCCQKSSISTIEAPSSLRIEKSFCVVGSDTDLNAWKGWVATPRPLVFSPLVLRVFLTPSILKLLYIVSNA